ncbi:MAG TPA: GAF domain-containing protein [Terriglobales bacterium]|nr:GAF domain-containing protein [Terriglobales bacterium]
MPTSTQIQEAEQEVAQLATTCATANELMAAIVKLLHRKMPHYNWVGFYMLEEPGPVLQLGFFEGAPTPHTRIPLNQGICGAAVSQGETVVVDDVSSDPRYLACSIETKSEIVAPVFADGQVVGELDVDSHTPAAFALEDRRLIEYCASVVGKHLENAGS